MAICEVDKFCKITEVLSRFNAKDAKIVANCLACQVLAIAKLDGGAPVRCAFSYAGKRAIN